MTGTRRGAGLRVGVLGPLQVHVGDVPVVVPGGKQAIVLASLAMSAGQPVSVEALAHYVWGERPPERVRGSLHTVVARLRHAVAAAPVLSGSWGYQLDIPAENVDLLDFRRLIAGTAGVPDPHRARELVQAALELWRGDPLAGLRSEVFQRDEAPRLAGERLTALQRRIELDLAAGEHDQLIPELRVLTERHPFRERFWALWMLALYRSGRAAEALEAYTSVRTLFDRELGIEPSPPLADLQQAILRNDPALGPPSGPPQVIIGSSSVSGGEWLRPHQLPADLSDLSGREEVLQRLAGPPPDSERVAPAVLILAIDGMAGVGKTAVAVRAAHLAGGRYPDAQLFINLHGHTPDREPAEPLAALEMLLRAVGVPGAQIPGALEERAGLWRAQLAGRRAVLVLDNAASAAQVRPLLPGVAGCLVLITSRRRLADLETDDSVSLDVLPPLDALALLSRLAGAERTAAGHEDAQDVVRLCGYLPLAIRIAGGRLRARPSWRMAHLARRLRDEQGRLAELAVGDRSVAAAFAMSYQQLTTDQQRLFRLLGLVPGPSFDADAAATLTGLAPGAAERALEGLVDVHLVEQPHPGHYQFHDLLRVYAGERAGAEENQASQDATLRRLSGFYTRTADNACRHLYTLRMQLPRPPVDATVPQRTFDDGQEALTWLNAQRLNLVAAAQHAADHGLHQVAIHLADAIRGHLFYQRHDADLRLVAAAGLRAAHVTGDRDAQAALYSALAGLAWYAGETQEALAHLTVARAAARDATSPEHTAGILAQFALLYLELGRLDEAADNLRNSLAIHERTKDTPGIIQDLTSFGQAYLIRGQLLDAEQVTRRALGLSAAGGPTHVQVVALNNLGRSQAAMGKLDAATSSLQQALALAEQLGYQQSRAETLLSLAITRRDGGRYDQALDSAQRSIALARSINSHRIEMEARIVLGTVHDSTGHYEQALTEHRLSLQLIERTGNPRLQIEAHLGISAALRGLGQSDQALAHARTAMTLASQHGFRLHEGRAHATLARNYLRDGRHGHAATHATLALGIYLETGHRLGQARAQDMLGQAIQHSDGDNKAQPHWQAALELYEEIGAPEATKLRQRLGIHTN